MIDQMKFFGISLLNTPALELSSKRKALRECFEFMRPKASPCQLHRIGGNGDGAYLVPACVDRIEACFSPGVANRKDFEDELFSKYSIRSHMCDYSSSEELLKTPLLETQTFRKLWLDINGDSSISLERWVNELEPDSQSLMLQMDIEGAEYRNILGTCSNVLSRFQIVLIELHNLAGLEDDLVLSQVYLPFFQKLNDHFACVHAHPNNCSGDFYCRDLEVRIPRTIELTLVNHSLFNHFDSVARCQPQAPDPLDVVNVPHLAPLFLDPKWLPDGINLGKSLHIIEKKQLDYFSQPQNFASVPNVNNSISWILEWAKAPKTLPISPSGDLQYDENLNCAPGKPFVCSSSYSERYPQKGLLPSRTDHFFFFHTEFAPAQFIAIDLQDTFNLQAIEVTNRLDTCFERAQNLFLCLSLKAALSSPPRPEESYQLLGIESFSIGPAIAHTIFCNGLSSRWIYFYSPAATALHFSIIKVFGKVAAL